MAHWLIAARQHRAQVRQVTVAVPGQLVGAAAPTAVLAVLAQARAQPVEVEVPEALRLVEFPTFHRLEVVVAMVRAV